MEGIKRYIDVIITTKSCNFKCHYCYISQLDNFENEIMTLSRTPLEIRNALSKERLGIINNFFSNIRMMYDNGVSFTLELTTCDELIPRIDELKRVCMENIGALPHITIARDDRTYRTKHLSSLSFEEYTKVWQVFDSELFNFKASIFYQRRKEFCYAGDYVAYLNLTTGDLYPCHGSSKKICNIFDDTVTFKAIGRCPLSHCYNGHSWLSFGAIPELVTPYYRELRDRVDLDGRHWLQPDVLNFFSTKTSENNEKYDDKTKRDILAKNFFDIKWHMVKRAGSIALRKLSWLKK